MKKQCRIDIRLKRDEKEGLLALARASGMTLSRYLINAGLSIQVIQDSALAAQLKEKNCWLGRICGNLHALAKYANFNKLDANSKLILSRITDVEREIKRFLP